MKDISPFPNKDLKLIRWQIGLALFSLILCVSLYMGSENFHTQAQRDLSTANANYARARQSVELIENEEATIIEYIGRYQEMSEAGIVAPEDRLQFSEKITEIRTANNLFPISLKVDKQASLKLSYPPAEADPGQPINLNSSTVELNLPLLHEEDLARLLRGILNSPGLYQIQNCSIKLQSSLEANFYTLAQHQVASCQLQWYTFDLNPPVIQEAGYF